MELHSVLLVKVNIVTISMLWVLALRIPLNMYLRNVGWLSMYYTTLYSRIQNSS
jgi:hypothetical protein